MATNTFLISVLVSVIAAVITFPVMPLQHVVNSFVRSTWLRLTLRPHGLSGRWFAMYRMPKNGGDELRTETVKCRQLVGGEIRGKIRDYGHGSLYSMLGKAVFNELAGHYWSKSGDQDIGTFKFKAVSQNKCLKGTLTVYDSVRDRTRNVAYEWRYWPRFTKYHAGRSAIQNTGMFSDHIFDDRELIGRLRYGPRTEHGTYTLHVAGQERIVKKPWRFLNHSCDPNCSLSFQNKVIHVVALKDIYPQDELTIDYRQLPGVITNAFQCSCPVCTAPGATPKTIGGSEAGSTLPQRTS